jgi:poly-gamma-glutamate synthesis protein (capsule biosynthesis protein)
LSVDVLLSRRIGSIIAREGPEFPFEHVHDVLREGDITMGNLESALSDSNTAVCDKDAHYCFKAPSESVNGLVYAGFDIMEVANNHALDYGPEVMNDTLSHLTTAGIHYDGVQQEPGDTVQKPVIFDTTGVKVAYLGFNDVWLYNNASGYLVNKYSTRDYPGHGTQQKKR